jgi:hypothetical protein
MAGKFGMEPAAFEQTVRAACGCDKATKEQFAAFLLVANEYGLNPITREIYAFPTRGGGIQPIVGIDGWMTMANNHAAYDGITFVDRLGDDGQLLAITAQVHRKDRASPDRGDRVPGRVQAGHGPVEEVAGPHAAAQGGDSGDSLRLRLQRHCGP